MTIDVPVESPQGNILNYSIVSSDEEENPLVLKLKISSSQKVPVVLIKKLEDINNKYVASPKMSNRIRKTSAIDKFDTDLIRTSPSKFENEAMSPKKRNKTREVEVDENVFSPRKKGREFRPQDSSLDDLCNSINKNVKLNSPVKRSLSISEYSDIESIESSPRKRGTPTKSTPRRGRSKNVEVSSPVKRDENQLILSGKRQTRTPVRYEPETTPKKSVKVNLNESFRRSVLRRLNLENEQKEAVTPRRTSLRESRRSVSIDTKLRKSSRKSFAPFYYCTSESEEEIEIVEVLKESEKELVKSERVLKNTKKSTVDECAQEEGNNCKQDDDLRRSRRKQIHKPREDPGSDFFEKSPERIEKKPNIVKTPKTPRNRRTTISTPKSVKSTPKTPKSTLKLIRDGHITPSMQSRSSKVQGDSTPLMKARTQLHVSYVPTSLPCREKEYLDVYNFLSGKLEDGCGGCMYISGVPGTGKTATVTSVINSLQKKKNIPKFSYVNINGMRLTEPRQSYVEIWKQLTGKTVPWEQAQSLLEERFTKKKNLSPVVMLIDELDILCTKRQDVVYNLLDWPTKSKDQLVVITIANTMDLPERLLMNRVTSRLGLTRLTFQAYTHKQLMEIVTKRLTGTDSFNSDAVQLVARKVASVSGDARRALDICRRAAEIAEEESTDQVVNIMHINQALTAMITQPQVMAIKRCSRLQKLILQAIVAEIERTGVEETSFADVYKMLVSCCALDDFKMVSVTVAQRSICELSACRLIITDQKCSHIHQKIILNVSVHDVYFALKKEA